MKQRNDQPIGKVEVTKNPVNTLVRLGGNHLGGLLVLLIIILVVVVDFFWLDIDRKRWGWMKEWDKYQKVLFFTGFIILSLLIYLGLSMNFFKI